MAGRRTAVINPAFKLGFIANCVICLASFFGAICVSYLPPGKHDEELFFVFKHLLMVGGGAFIGLLGGKASGPS